MNNGIRIRMLFFFSFLNSGSDLGDIEQALRNGTTKKVKGSGSCSALVKLFDENKELAISHVTWNDYLGMLRIYKFYNLSFHTTPSKGLFFSFYRAIISLVSVTVRFLVAWDNYSDFVVNTLLHFVNTAFKDIAGTNYK